jgi:two-component system NtrC family response regulator
MDTSAPLILVADDDESLRRVLEFQLREAGYATLTAADGLAALDLFTAQDLACLIADVQMPGLNGLELLRRANAVRPAVPVLVITAYGDVQTAVAAMRGGAFDFITKPFNRAQLLLTVEKALKYGATLAENRQLRRLVHERFQLANVVGASEALRRVLEVVAQAAPTDATVLITGASGTGKELIAKGLHCHSRRAAGPFIPVNCAALPETLIEAELFGYKRGAFTGAIADTKGKFEEASNGTLFLDEISTLPLALQPKLLRVLQEQEIVRLGESRPRRVNARILAATNQDLAELARAGAFRGDLYYRLAVVPVELPPLRARREDIPLLAEHFLRRSCERHRRASLRLAPEVFAAFGRYAWPGNVRELENLIERLAVLTPGDTVTLSDLPEQLQQPAAHGLWFKLPPNGFALEDLEQEIIRQALARHGGNQSQTARYLGISRSTLIYRLQKAAMKPGV